jgi:hypothetical protein
LAAGYASQFGVDLPLRIRSRRVRSFASGSIDDWGRDRVERAESVDAHGQWETWSDRISVVDGNLEVHALFELWSDTSGTADGVYVDDVCFREGAVSLPSLAGKTVTGGRADAPRRGRECSGRACAGSSCCRPSFPNEADAVTGNVTVGRLQLRAARYRTRPGRPVPVKVRLRPGARRALASGARKRIALRIRARDTAGNTAVTRRRVTLRAP